MKKKKIKKLEKIAASHAVCVGFGQIVFAAICLVILIALASAVGIDFNRMPVWVNVLLYFTLALIAFYLNVRVSIFSHQRSYYISDKKGLVDTSTMYFVVLFSLAALLQIHWTWDVSMIGEFVGVSFVIAIMSFLFRYFSNRYFVEEKPPVAA